ncbi:hypothetical protein LHYA1_G000703 [Lachnellula hyalina]|uniref:Uncharacterized protein n=1 Tax=Lachnellula hyalina TaxID=1316788 RepID=A0A8H8R8C4_9HELO|nr:uncharacterized protein LHYA1_G000703 [Lachnellula hyalina]TVY30220.1 hypothetical protein LHYA1_G000703 [Lachnellula hyalina]
MHLFLATLALALDVVAANINSTVELGIETACKVCPWQKCINTKVYPYFDDATEQDYDNVTLVCWTRGENVGGADGNKSFEWDEDKDQSELKYCGRDSEEEFYTTQDASTKYDTECNINPAIDSDTLEYLVPDKDLTATIWIRSTSLCYAAQKGLHHNIDKTSLDNCGPLPSLEVNRTTPFSKPRRAEPLPDRAQLSKSKRKPNPTLPLQPRYLISVTVGEDYASCHEQPRITAPVIKQYPWMEQVFLQCLTSLDPDPLDPVTDDTWWELTTDFCYVRSVDFWESPEGDFSAV